MIWLILSMRAWMVRNSGIARRRTTNRKIPMIGRITASEAERGTSCRRAMMMPPMASIGAMTIRVSPIAISICTCWTSLVLRVMSDGVPKRPISLCERLSTFR